MPSMRHVHLARAEARSHRAHIAVANVVDNIGSPGGPVVGGGYE